MLTHVDDYLNDPASDPIAVEFLEHARRPAIYQDVEWLRRNSPWVTWQGNLYRCVGASRMGDVWLKTAHGTGGHHYDYRVDIEELSQWTRPEPYEWR